MNDQYQKWNFFLYKIVLYFISLQFCSNIFYFNCDKNLQH